MKQTYKTLVIASLLHDIGKFYRFKTGSSHIENGMILIRKIKELGEKLNKDVEINKIEYLIENHHKQVEHTHATTENTMLNIIKKCDREESKEREGSIRFEEETKRIEIPLKNPIGLVVPSEASKREEEWYLKGKRVSKIIEELSNSISTYEKNKTFSELIVVDNKKDSEIEEYYSEKNWNEFEDLILTVFQSKDIEVLINNLNLILFDFTMFIPSSVRPGDTEGQYVSLYNHLKLTASLSCTKELKSEDITIISLDIGGIQNFISSAHNYERAREKATKRIRGRSFIITLITKLISLYLLKKLELPIVNELHCSSGSLIILSKKIDDSIKEEIKKEIEDFIFKEFDGELSISISFIEKAQDQNITSESLFSREKFKDLLNSSFINLSESKARRFSSIINEIAKKNEINIGNKICEVCGNIIDVESSNEDDVCRKCRLLEKLGEELVKSDGVAIYEYSRDYDVKEKEFVFSIGPFKYVIVPLKLNKIDYRNLPDYFLFYFINFKDVLDNKELIKKVKLLPLFEYSFVPSENGEIWTIEEEENEEINNSLNRNSLLNKVPIEEKEIFREEMYANFNKLAIGYFDIDNAGKIFSGEVYKFLDVNENSKEIILKEYQSKEMTISKWVTLSFYVNFFFSVLNYYLAKRRNIYIVFSGGDDVTFFGSPYEVFKYIIDFSKEFETYFKRRISFSGGIILGDSKTPVMYLLEEVRSLEKQSKKRSFTNKEEKGKIGILNKDYIVPWLNYRHLEEVFEEILRVYYREEVTKGGALSISTLFNIYEISKSHLDKFNITKLPTKKIYVGFSRIQYLLKRNWKDSEKDWYVFFKKCFEDPFVIFDNNTIHKIYIFTPVFSFAYNVLKNLERR
ncbi:MAG: type III-A CRISPR-associated protein Cas10/Csm1 [Candidatus Aenigmatarchaeota archaeon]